MFGIKAKKELVAALAENARLKSRAETLQSELLAARLRVATETSPS